MASINHDTRYRRCRNPLVKPNNATHSGLRARWNQPTYVVRAAIRNRSVKGESAITGDCQIVAQVVLNHHPAIGAYQAHDRAADGVKNSRADDLNVSDVGQNRAAAVGHRAGLVRAGRLGKNRYRINGAGGEEGRKRKSTVRFE